MRFPVMASLLLLTVPLATGTAQRGGRGGGGGGGGRRGGNTSQAPADAMQFPSKSDLGKFNPAALLIDKKKDLALADAQVATLKTLQQTITDRNADLLTRYDSVLRAYKPEKIPSAEIEDPAIVEAAQMRLMLDTLSMRRVLDVSDAVAVVTDEAARQKAAALFLKQDVDYRAKLPMSRARSR